ncbi:DUF4258 domain-containing protein [Anaerovibrio lipolyticus]|uniref:DUF4258 domain-containing protein n=1 Tax=Anaerovibrio lipolyticus TaxID=82374 RepID=UPI0025FBB021|nr:DUF4258 domain-containing protein [Anaerovibrio lipolyticus]
MLKKLCQDGKVEWTNHVAQRLLQRGITRQEVKQAILMGEIIENYPDDYPYPSCLILGGNHIHVVCGIGEGRLWIITAYRPSLEKWESDLKTRKEH